MSDNNTQNLENLNKLFNAIDTIVQKRIENLPYDKTIIATIEDASKASEGQYVVNDGTITFLAYSENTTYTQGQQVYINIPQGDYNKQRIIVGKYFPNDDKKFIYNYVSPMNTFANVSGNIISSDQNQWALIANGAQKSITLYEDYVSFSGYDTLGVSAEFRTWLNNYKDVSSGTYGLQIDVASGDNIEEHPEDALFYTFYFTNKDMFGDPYNYDTFFSQEKVFDISGLKKIDAIRVKFFQDQDFIFSTNNTYMNPGDENDESSYNLFIRNPVVAIGYDLSKFSDDTVLIYTSDGKIFFSSATEDLKAKYKNIDFTKEEEALPIFNKVNQKNLGVRWIHLFKEEEKSGVYNISSSGVSSTRAITIDDETDFDEPFNIKWFRYNKQENSSNIQYDKNVGEYWDEITEEKNSYFITVKPNIKKENEQYLAMIEYPSLESVKESIEEELSKTLYIQKSELLNKDILIGENQNYLNLFFSEITIDTVQNIQDSILAIEKDYKEKLQLYTSNSTLTEEERLSLIEEINSINRNHEQALNYLNALITALNNNSPTENLNFSLYITPYKIYNYFLELLNDNIIDYLKHLDKIISDLKKIIEDSSELQTQVQSTLDSSKYSIIVKELKNLFPEYFSQDYIIAFLNIGYDVNNPDVYKTSIKTFLETFREEFPNINEYDFGNDNQNEKEALLFIKENIDQINKVDNDIQEYKSVELGKINHYLSKPIVFENNDPNAALNAVKDNLSELQILVDEGGLQGIYNVYREDGYIQNDSYVNELRTLEVQYPDGSNPIGENETITWKFPLINTMIQEPEEGIEYNLFTEASEGEVTADNFKNGNYYYWDEEDNKYIQIIAISQISDNNGNLHDIEFNNNGTYYIKNNNINVYKENGYFIIKKTGKDNTEQSFRIKSFLSPANTNNEIYCSIAKEINDLSASASLSFPSSGIQGTNYSFYLEFYNNKNNFALQAKGSAEETRMNVRARLFNEAHKEITSQYSFTWGLVNSSDGIGVSSSNSSSCQIYSKIPEEDWNPTKFAHGILKCTCEVNIDFDHQYQYMKYNNQNHSAKLESQEKSTIQLTAYLLIPVIKDGNSIGGYTGSGYICYDNAGANPQYYNSPFKVYSTSLESTDGIWEIYEMDYSEISLTQKTYKPNKYYILQNGQYILSTGSFNVEQTYFNSEESFYPRITTDGSLMVPSIYIADEKPLSLQYKINNIVEFILPLKIYKYVYGNKFINSWDGSLTLNENDGIILSTMMGAGYKGPENKFNGVVMGDMNPTNEEETEGNIFYAGAGIYGFNQGEKSFGFNIHGNGFIGKTSGAQILFNGNEGQLSCASYAAADGWENVTNNSGQAGGILIDLDESFIDFLGEKESYFDRNNNKLYGRSHISIDANPGSGPFFRITNAQKKDLIYIGGQINGGYYLKSANYNGSIRANGSILNNGTEGTYIDLKDGYFNSTSGGKIGCWSFNVNQMYDDSDSRGYTGVNKYGSGMAFWAGGTDLDGNNAPFHVNHSGVLTSQNNGEQAYLRWGTYAGSGGVDYYYYLYGTKTKKAVLTNGFLSFSENWTNCQWYNGPDNGQTTSNRSITITLAPFYEATDGSPWYPWNGYKAVPYLNISSSVKNNGFFWCTNRAAFGSHVDVEGNIECWGNLRLPNKTGSDDSNRDVHLNGDGWVYTTKNSSSKRFKNNIKILDQDYVSQLYNIPVYTFKYNDDWFDDKKDERFGKILPGFISEDWDNILPESVTHDNKGLPLMWNYQVVVPLMFQMIKNDHEKIESLEQKITQLEKLINEKFN